MTFRQAVRSRQAQRMIASTSIKPRQQPVIAQSKGSDKAGTTTLQLGQVLITIREK
jgi:hypothetical protein